MAGFLAAWPSVVGRLTPAAQGGRWLGGRGHDVHWYTGAGLRPPVEEAGATFHPVTHEIDFTRTSPVELIPELRTASKLERIRLYFERAFVDAAPGTVRDLEAILAEFP